MANPRRNASSGLTGTAAFKGTLKRLNAKNFTLGSAGRNANTTTVNVTRRDGTTTSFQAPTDVAVKMSAAKTGGAIRGSGSSVDKA